MDNIPVLPPLTLRWRGEEEYRSMAAAPSEPQASSRTRRILCAAVVIGFLVAVSIFLYLPA